MWHPASAGYSDVFLLERQHCRQFREVSVAVHDTQMMP